MWISIAIKFFFHLSENGVGHEEDTLTFDVTIDDVNEFTPSCTLGSYTYTFVENANIAPIGL